MLIFCMFILIILTSILAFAYVRDYFYGKQKLSRLKAGQIIYHGNKLLKVVEVPVQPLKDGVIYNYTGVTSTDINAYINNLTDNNIKADWGLRYLKCQTTSNSPITIKTEFYK